MTPSGRYNQLELRCRSGEFTLDFEAEWDPPAAALFGPSGSGKSTILEIIAGVRRGASGRVVLDGRTILDTERGIEPAARDRWIGWVPQDASLFPHLTVRENVRFGLSRGGPEGERRLAAAVALLELEPLLERPAVALSGGERQRAAVARAIASGARVLLLDEPLASLDVPLRARIFPLFLRLRDELGLPMLYVTHDAEEVLALSPHVLVIEQGRCVASGRSEALLGMTPRCGCLRAPCRREPVRRPPLRDEPGRGDRGGRAGRWVAARDVRDAPPARGEFEVVLRGEEIILGALPPGPVSAQNVLEGTVVAVREREGSAWVTVRALGAEFVARITRRALGDLGLAEGRPAWLVFKASSIRAVTRTDRA